MMHVDSTGASPDGHWVLVLEDGTVFRGVLVGYERVAVGEVVFTTANVGYPQSLTDPSYRGQILVFTMPLIGNYGVSEDDFESDHVQVEAAVAYEFTEPSHYKSVMSVREWLLAERVPALARVDTRALAIYLREHGVMMGAVAPSVEEGLEAIRRSPRYDEVDYTALVTPREPIEHGSGKRCVAVIDCGVKRSIVANLVRRGLRVVRYPCHLWGRAVAECDAVLFSNGPGNPNLLQRLVPAVHAAVEYGKPVMGICLGHQVIAMAMGAKLRKLKYGHRAINKPVLDLSTGRVYITTHNHGYAVDPDSARSAGFDIWFVQPDDGTVEGLRHRRYPVITTQFHPESAPGPWDTTWVFDVFAKMVDRFGGV